MKRWVSLGWKGLVSAGLIGYLLARTPIGSIEAHLGSLAWGGVLAALAVLFVQILSNAARWHVTIRALSGRLPGRRVVRLSLIGVFFNNVLPSSIGGDAVRVWMASRDGLTVGTALNTVMIERLVHVVGLLAMVALGQPLLYDRIGDQASRAVFPLLSLAAVALIALLMALDRLPARWRVWRPMRGAATLASDLRRIVLSFRTGLGVLGLSLVSHALLCVVVWLLAASMAVDLSLVEALVLVPPVMLLSTLPISIAGWGVREGAMAAALGLVGVPAESAVVVSILFGLLSIVAGLPGGALWLTERAAVPRAAPGDAPVAH